MGQAHSNCKFRALPFTILVWGFYGSTADNLYDTAACFQANACGAPIDVCFVFVYTAATRTLQYFLSYYIGPHEIFVNFIVPQTAVDAQTVGLENSFCKDMDWYSF